MKIQNEIQKNDLQTEEQILAFCRDQSRIEKKDNAPSRVKNEWMTEDQIDWSIFTNLGFMGLSHYWISPSGIVLKKRFDRKNKNQKKPQYKYCFQSQTGSTKKPKQKRYWYVFVVFDDRRHQSLALHYLLGRAFIPGYKEGLEIDHKNSITTDNYVDVENPENSNLRWCTHSQNIKFAYENPNNYKGYTRRTTSIVQAGS